MLGGLSSEEAELLSRNSPKGFAAIDPSESNDSYAILNCSAATFFGPSTGMPDVHYAPAIHLEAAVSYCSNFRQLQQI